MGSLLLVPGLDTRLARALLERRRVEYPTLHAALTKVRALRRSSPHTLALELVELGLVDVMDLEATIAGLLGGHQAEGWKIGQRVAGLELLGSLGAGGMGEVLLARDLETGSEVAVKTLRIDEEGELLARFQREAEAQARVDAHPNVVRIHRSGTAGGRAFLVMDAVRGGDLARRLTQGPLEPVAAAELVRDLAQGLAYAHARGVLHRDLKPANVLFDERGHPRLADFGLARLLEADALTQTGEVLGTPSYMAPEQATSGATDERTDVYGLGGILYAALTGSPPFEGATVYALLEQVLTAPAPDPRERVSEIPAELAELCGRCLEKSPEDRFASALEVSAALERFLEGSSGSGARRELGLWLVIPALVLCGALGAFALRSQGSSGPTPAAVTAASPTAAQSRPPLPAEIRTEIERLGPGLEGALLAESYLARGLGSTKSLKARAAKPFLRTRIDEVSGLVPLDRGRLFAWRASKQFDSRPLAFLVEETGKVSRTWNERVICASPGGQTIVFLTREGSLRLVESETWQEVALTKRVALLGAAFGPKGDLWIVGGQALRRLSLDPLGEPRVVWEPPVREDASSVYPLPDGNLLVASGRAANTLTRLRCLSAEGKQLWAAESEAFDGKPRAIEVSPNGRWVLFGTASGQIVLFETAAEPRGLRKPVHMFERPRLDSSPTDPVVFAPRAHQSSTVSLNWISDDLFLSTDDDPPALNFWRRDGECLATDLFKRLAPHRVEFSRDGKLAYVISEKEGLVTGVLRSSLVPAD